MKMYEVGGCIRDEILGVKSHDIDYTVEFEFHDAVSVDPYKVMVANLENMGVTIIRDREGMPVGAEYLTVRGIAPKDFPNHPGRALDFVLSRKEEGYTDGRRPDKVVPGTLYDDLARRDFTMNAIAKDPLTGEYIDPFGGIKDIENRVIRAVGDPFERLNEDALRAVRALRFAVTKGFKIDPELETAMDDREICQKVIWKIADERIEQELSKMFRFSTIDSLYELSTRNRLTVALFSGSVSLDATMKTKGRGK